VRFRRLGRGGTSEVAAHWRAITPAILCTALRYPDGAMLRTVEHLLAALSAFAIDNALVEIEGEELPIFDGSARPWCEAIAEAGRLEQKEPRSYLRILSPVAFAEGDHSLRIEPADSLTITVEVPLAHFGHLRWSGEITPEAFARELAPARSFGRLKWALPLKLYNLLAREPVLRGATLRSTAAIVGGRIIGGMTVPEEPARHRVIDVVGDLALVGYPILGHVIAHRPGHATNHGLIETLMARPDAWEIVDAEGRRIEADGLTDAR
jgi:UDP-3-O-[3-hydroxymyristoyl] N-acetylglucosamine deacetylase